jgi:hypothetical protein
MYIPIIISFRTMKVLIVGISLILVALAQAPPTWPVRFQQDFVETYASTPIRDVGKLWFDSERKMSRMDRNNGRYDQFCGSVLNAATPCTQLVRDGKRYIIYPFLRSCCECCDAAHGCGIMRRDWLREAEYVGKD